MIHDDIYSAVALADLSGREWMLCIALATGTYAVVKLIRWHQRFAAWREHERLNRDFDWKAPPDWSDKGMTDWPPQKVDSWGPLVDFHEVGAADPFGKD